jgi:hypothetical protein
MSASFQWIGNFENLFEKIFHFALGEVLRIRVPGYLLPKMCYVVSKRLSVRREKLDSFLKFKTKMLTNMQNRYTRLSTN